MDYEHYILQGEAKSTEFSDDRSYLLVQKANSHCACVGQTEECCLPKIDEIDDFGSLLYSCLDRCVRCLVISTLLLPHLSKQKSFQVHQLFGPPDLIWSLHMCALCGDFEDRVLSILNMLTTIHSRQSIRTKGGASSNSSRGSSETKVNMNYFKNVTRL